MRYLMREIFHCERGKVPQMLEDVKELDQAMTGMGMIKNTRICVDLSGRFDTVVYEGEVDSLDQSYEGERAAAANADEQYQQLADRMNANTVEGYRELWEIVS